MSVMLEVPNDVTQAMHLPPPEAEARLRFELAVGLYTKRLLSLGKGAHLARLNRWEFEEVLGQRGIPAHYTEEDLVHNTAYATVISDASLLISLGAEEGLADKRLFGHTPLYERRCLR